MKNKRLFDLLPIAREFYNVEMNVGIDGETLGVGSKKEVYWTCPKCGETTRAKVYCKARKLKDGSYTFSTCKKCFREFSPSTNKKEKKVRKRKPKISEVDELMNLWDENNNPGLSPQHISSTAPITINWKCPECGSQWECTARAMSLRNSKCMQCSSRKKKEASNIFTVVPEAKDFWDEDENKDIDIETITVSSSTIVCWKCPRCNKKSFAPVVYKIRKKGESYIFKGCNRCSRSNPSRSTRGSTSGQNSITTEPALIRIWDADANIDIRPEELYKHSNRMVNWKCPECGFRWQKRVYQALYSSGKCPQCTMRNTISAGYNDVFSLAPDAKKDYDFEANKAIDISKLGVASSTKVWWKCCQCGKETYSPIKNKIKRNVDGTYRFSPCPCTCRGSKKNTDTIRPISTDEKLMRIWDDNNTLNPTTVLTNSTKTANWKCPTCGYSWLSKIYYVARSYGLCPCCDLRRVVIAGVTDFLTLVPELKNHYDYENNKEVDASSLGISSKRKVYWKCPECGFKYISSIKGKIKKDEQGRYYITKCRNCRGKGVKEGKLDSIYAPKHFDLGGKSLWHLYPDIAEIWSSRNTIKPIDVLPSSPHNVYWNCKECGGEYDSPVRDMVSGVAICPFCNNLRVLPGLNSLEDLYPSFAQMWSQENEKSACEVSPYSHVLAIWNCSQCNGRFRGPIDDVAVHHKVTCPYCDDRRVLAGLNSLDVTHPHVAKMWSAKNERPVNSVGAGYTIDAIWRCPVCEGEYTAQINDVADGRFTCPYCNGRRILAGFNSLDVTHPDVAKRWSANNERSVDSVGADYSYNALWVCEDCGGEYSALVKNIVDGTADCPYCNDRRVLPGFNSLAVRYPHLLSEWDYIRNYVSDLNPDKILSQSHGLVWWRCPNRHTYRMSPKKRVLLEKRHKNPCWICKGHRREKQHYI